MSMIADKIEKFILDRMREEQEKLILKRNELADEVRVFLMSAVSMLSQDVAWVDIFESKKLTQKVQILYLLLQLIGFMKVQIR